MSGVHAHSHKHSHQAPAVSMTEVQQPVENTEVAASQAPTTGPAAEAAAREAAQATATQAAIEAEQRAVQQHLIENYGEITINAGQIRPKYFGEYLPSHLFDVVDGMGFTLAKAHGHSHGHDHEGPNVKDPMLPDLLMYAPKDPTQAARTPLGREGSFTDFWPDGEYVLIGWGYYSDYDPKNPMQVGSIPSKDVFIHEAGFHTSDGGFLATPPAHENYLGELATPAPKRRDHRQSLRDLFWQGVIPVGKHSRSWDLHVWRSDLHTGADTAPVISAFLPEEFDYLPAQALDLSAGFFYPEQPEGVVADNKN